VSSHIPQYGNLHEFKKEDVFRNTIKVHPNVQFFIYSGSVYYNNESQKTQNFHTPNGHINLYELNVNRNNVSSSSDTQLIFPFVTKNGTFSSFSTISDSSFLQDFNYGDVISGSYPLTSSISVNRFGNSLSAGKKRFIYALRNTLDYYTYLNPRYAYSSSFGNKEAQKLNIVSIPSIFYGSTIKKGSVILKYYFSGSLIGEASDKDRNGVLYHTSGTEGNVSVGDAVGVVLYNEGFVVITSSANLSTNSEQYGSNSSQISASWHYFGLTSSFAGAPSSSFDLQMQGENYIQTVTMMAHARENQVNFSNNPTFCENAIATQYSSSNIYYEDAQRQIKNIYSSSYANYSASFKPVTYISKVGIYDENKNLIAVASLANPVRKLEERSYTFKLKLDI
tara:strand:+ start:5330 stop:6511 length:1182 start_codon:yes stop_codon:yes gene_type:complete